MSTEPSRQEYARRMNRVLAHIDRHLDAPLDLLTLAEVADFSPFHFHRLFTALMGETVGDYLRRRRLEVAAQRLAVQPSLSVLQAALAGGSGRLRRSCVRSRRVSGNLRRRGASAAGT